MMKSVTHLLLSGYHKVATLAILFVSISASASDAAGSTWSSSYFSITVIISDNQNVWAGTAGQGLLRFSKKGGAPEIFTATNSGLTDDDIRGLAFDTSGALLIGTLRNGVVRFDGTAWKSLPSMSGEMITGISVDRGGRIWVSTRSNLQRLTNGSWEIIINRINGTLCVDPYGDVWLYDRKPESECSSGFIYEYSDGGLNRTIALDHICPETVYPYFFAADGKKNAWLGGGSRILKINESKIDSITLHSDTEPRQISALTVNHRDVLMAALKNASGSTEFYLYDQINGKGNLFDSAAVTLRGFSVTASCADRDGSFFCAGSDGSVIRIASTGDTSSISKGISILPSNSISSVVIDKSNALWAGTANGIVRCDRNAWTTYPQSGDTVPGTDVSSLSLDSSGTLWAGFQQNPIMSSLRAGLAHFTGEHWRRFTLDHISVKKTATDRTGDLWTVCDDGVYRYRNNSAERLFETIPSSVRDIALGTMVHSIAFDKNNTPWIGTGLGLKKYVDGVWADDSTVNLFPAPGSSLIGASVTMLSFDYSGTLWAGTGRGLIRYSSGVSTLFDTTDAVLPSNSVQSIAFDTNTIVWIGTKLGLVKLVSDKRDHQTFTSLNSALLDNDITALALAKNGDLWIGTRLGGLTRFPADSIATSPSTSVFPGYHSQPQKKISWNIQSGSSYRISINISHPATTRLTLLSMDGRTIRSYTRTHSGKATYTWDGSDTYNHRVPSGIYLAVLSEGGKIISSKVLPMP